MASDEPKTAFDMIQAAVIVTIFVFGIYKFSQFMIDVVETTFCEAVRGDSNG